MFIADNRDNYYPLSRVTSGGSRWKEAHQDAKSGRLTCEGWFKTQSEDGETTHYCMADFATELARIALHLIPSSPGTKIVFWNWHKDKLNHWDDHCIGWACCADGQIRPVTAEGVISDIQNYAVQYPDGTIEIPAEWNGENVAALLDYLTTEYAKTPAVAS